MTATITMQPMIAPRAHRTLDVAMPAMLPDLQVTTDDSTLQVRRRTLPQYEAAMQWARQAKLYDANMCRSWASLKPSTGWHGGLSNSAYEKMLRDGWPEGINGVEGLDGLASDSCERLTFERDVAGAFPVVPAFIAGDPCSMLMPRPDRNDNVRGVTLVIDHSFHAGVEGHTVLSYAQTVMRLIAWLEAERIETSVYSVHTAIYDSGRVMHVVPIREAGQIVQPERLASIVHPAMLRRAQFSMLEYECAVLGHHKGKVPWGYGTPSHASIAELQAVLPDVASVILLPKVGSGDPQKAVEETLNLKLKQGD